MIELKQTCRSHPSQWDGRTVSGYPFYVRYRFGRLSVQLGVKDAAVDGMEICEHGITLFDQHVGDKYDGDMDWDAVTACAGNILAL